MLFSASVCWREIARAVVLELRGLAAAVEVYDRTDIHHLPKPALAMGGTKAISRSSGEQVWSPTYASFSLLVSQGGYSGPASVLIF